MRGMERIYKKSAMVRRPENTERPTKGLRTRSDRSQSVTELVSEGAAPGSTNRSWRVRCPEGIGGIKQTCSIPQPVRESHASLLGSADI